MCNGASSRTARGGSIAILHPHHAQPHQTEPEDFQMLMSNHDDISQGGYGGTRVEFAGWRDQSIVDGECWVIIHRDGDLSQSASESNPIPPSDPFYSFRVEDAVRKQSIELPEKLFLGVGDDGVIGRRVSLVTRVCQEPLVVAEGIMGWN